MLSWQCKQSHLDETPIVRTSLLCLFQAVWTVNVNLFRDILFCNAVRYFIADIAVALQCHALNSAGNPEHRLFGLVDLLRVSFCPVISVAIPALKPKSPITSESIDSFRRGNCWASHQNETTHGE